MPLLKDYFSGLPRRDDEMDTSAKRLLDDMGKRHPSLEQIFTRRIPYFCKEHTSGRFLWRFLFLPSHPRHPLCSLHRQVGGTRWFTSSLAHHSPADDDKHFVTHQFISSLRLLLSVPDANTDHDIPRTSTTSQTRQGIDPEVCVDHGSDTDEDNSVSFELDADVAAIRGQLIGLAQIFLAWRGRSVLLCDDDSAGSDRNIGGHEVDVMNNVCGEARVHTPRLAELADILSKLWQDFQRVCCRSMLHLVPPFPTHFRTDAGRPMRRPDYDFSLLDLVQKPNTIKQTNAFVVNPTHLWKELSKIPVDHSDDMLWVLSQIRYPVLDLATANATLREKFTDLGTEATPDQIISVVQEVYDRVTLYASERDKLTRKLEFNPCTDANRRAADTILGRSRTDMYVPPVDVEQALNLAPDEDTLAIAVEADPTSKVLKYLHAKTPLWNLDTFLHEIGLDSSRPLFDHMARFPSAIVALVTKDDDGDRYLKEELKMTSKSNGTNTHSTNHLDSPTHASTTLTSSLTP
eukprot:TRINITY_DN3703_c0_g2_i2.p1 TRINITY_DN3703_c0_g2~~TRINITY_DN3703_c0_g2_i2.p1  ORF type:complete len:518 (+),score=67.05 TRINITY_DN3703_c0_g2_i2:472-2025(+)